MVNNLLNRNQKLIPKLFRLAEIMSARAKAGLHNKIGRRTHQLLALRAKLRPFPRYTDENFKFRGPKKKDGTGGQR